MHSEFIANVLKENGELIIGLNERFCRVPVRHLSSDGSPTLCAHTVSKY
jgi:hypothetical protein